MSEPTAEQIVEALLFASPEPVSEEEIQAVLGGRAEAEVVLRTLDTRYAGDGVRLKPQQRRGALRMAPEVAPFLARIERRLRRLSKAALETLAVIAYRQPATRGQIEAVRGVAVSRGTLDLLLELALVALRGRKEAPGRPVLWLTTPAFLDHFGLAALDNPPRIEELEGASLFGPSSAR